MRASNPGARVDTSPLDRIQQRRAVLLSILDGRRLPRGPRLPLRGKLVSPGLGRGAFHILGSGTVVTPAPAER